MAAKVKAIHGHSISSMYYDNRPEDTSDGKGVIDVEYNSGRIERTLANTKALELVKDFFFQVLDIPP